MTRLATLGVLLAFGIVVSASAAGTAWSQPDTVRFQKISHLEGNLGVALDNLDEFGGAVVHLGDLDGAGPSVAALAVGAIGDDDGGSQRGAVYVLFLNDSAKVVSRRKISDLGATSTLPLDNGDEFGGALAYLGDLDGAGPSVAALAVGTALDDDGGLSRGAVYVLFLDSAANVLSHQKISDLQGNFGASFSDADEFAGAMCGLGDLDGAGPSTGAMAVGAIGDDDGGSDRGCVYVLFLDTAGMVITFQKISDTAGNLVAPLDNADEFGSAVANLGDLDGGGPGVTALAVGAIGDDDGGTNRGATYILFLDAAGNVLNGQPKITDLTLEGSPLDDNDEFGGAFVGLGDLDGSGPSVSALAVGAALDDDGGGDRGAVYVLHLLATGVVDTAIKISDTQGNFTGVLGDGDDFGGSLAALGDIDGSGEAIQAMVVGAAADDDGGGDRGAIYVLFLKSLPPVVGVGDPPRAALNLLGRSRPNPFKSRTAIPFRLQEAARVQIDVWDIHGRHVRNLVHRTFGPGDHEAVWDGLGDSGRRLPSGTYLYRMSVNGRTVAGSGKAVLLE